ncbi:MAG: helix-turn-helix domain-containing protein [Bacteroidota bacterium]
MDIPFSLPVILTSALISQGIFAAILLFFQRNNSLANRYLAFLLLAFSLWLIDSFFRVSTIYEQNANYYFLPIYYSLAFGPLVYFYTQALTKGKRSLSARNLGHFIPVILQLGLYVFLQSQSYEFRRDFWFEVHRPFTYRVEFILTFFSLGIYLVASMRVLKKYQAYIRNAFSEISRINLYWLRLVLGVMIFLSITWLLDALLREVWVYYPKQNFSSIAIGISLLVLAGGALLQSPLKELGFNSEDRDTQLPKSSQQDLDPLLLERIQWEMKERKYYLNPRLTLESFARELKEPSRLISQHINQGLGVSFIDFVNQFRVEAVKQRMESEDRQTLTLLGMALESGFNSKSTFNRIFKKFTGKSPSAYMKRSQNKN